MRTRFLLSALPWILLAAASHAQPLEPSTRILDFGTVVADQAAERSVTVTNRGTAQVRIRNVQLTPPLSITRMKSLLEPGQSAEIAVRLGAPRPAGKFEGQLSVNFAGEAQQPLIVDVSANLVPAIEVRPRPGLIAVTERGTEARDALEIVSHLGEPLQITGGSVASERYSTTLETLEPGKRYRLSLVLSGKGKSGPQTDTISLQTDSTEHPVVRIIARTMLRERVYTFPDKLDLGRIVLASARSTQRPETSVMVYQKGGEDFQIKVSTDVPFLVVRPEKSAMFGDRWQIFCSIDPARLTAGRTSGSLTVETNDKEFPRLVVPVDAVVE